MKTIYRRLFRDLVDTILLLAIIAFIINQSLSPRPDMLLIAFLSLFLLYILGVMWRMGAAIETLNEYIKDEKTRRELNMLPYNLRYNIYIHNWKEWVLLSAVVAILTAFVISNS